jgi:hypothetical protein
MGYLPIGSCGNFVFEIWFNPKLWQSRMAQITMSITYIAQRPYPMESLLPINDQLNKKDLFEAFKLQLAKDFVQSNFEVGFVQTLEPAYASIHEKIMVELQRNEKRADSNLMQLLYRIDISEAQLKKYLNEANNENHLGTIAELIIKRVLQKVVIKQYYKLDENG